MHSCPPNQNVRKIHNEETKLKGEHPTPPKNPKQEQNSFMPGYNL